MAGLNYSHLRYFRAIAHEGGLTRAAERLNLSQSALSVQLRALEHQLGQDLFDRTGRRLTLTEAGRIALDYADTVFQAGEEMLTTLQGRRPQRRQTMQVGALTTLSRNFQLEFLRPLLARDDVDLVLRSGATRALLAELEAHSLDVVLANSPARSDTRHNLRSHLLGQQPVALVGRPQRFRFPDDLAVVRLILPGRDSGIRMAFDQMLERRQITPQLLAEVDDMAMLRLLAREGDGVTLVPPIVVRDELESGALVELCQVPDVVESFYAIVQERRFPNPLLADLVTRGIVA